MPLLTIAVALWILKQLTSHYKGFETRTIHGHHNIEPKYKPHDDVGLPRDGDNWCDRTPAPCDKLAGSCTPCSGGPEGMCLDNGDGAGGRRALMQPDGKWRRYKMPNYYGLGLCGGYGYGEPYYARAVKY